MKVLCIDAENGGHPIKITEGRIYEVLREDSKTFGMRVYFLTNFPKSPYDANRFIPLSTIDETEMIRNYQTEKV